MYVTQAKYTVYSSNPWESNHRDGPTGHKNTLSIPLLMIICHFASTCPLKLLANMEKTDIKRLVSLNILFVQKHILVV